MIFSWVLDHTNDKGSSRGKSDLNNADEHSGRREGVERELCDWSEGDGRLPKCRIVGRDEDEEDDDGDDGDDGHEDAAEQPVVGARAVDGVRLVPMKYLWKKKQDVKHKAMVMMVIRINEHYTNK